MTLREAEVLVDMIDGHWKMYLHVNEASRGMWVDFVQKYDDVEMVTRAVATLAERQPQRPTIADLRGMITKCQADARASLPSLPATEFKRELPDWVKGWLVARAEGDMRVWLEQRPGYDAIQREHPETRTHVWSRPGSDAGRQTPRLRRDGSEALRSSGWADSHRARRRAPTWSGRVMDDPQTRSTEVLREEAAEAARRLTSAHERGDSDSFHFNLGQIVVLAQLIYEGNIREGKA